MGGRDDFLVALEGVCGVIGEVVLGDGLPGGVFPDYLREGVLAYPVRGGKCLRPALCMWVCGAVGGDPLVARRVGAGIELFHTWTLVHDDIIDEDVVRRGEPTVHALVEVVARERFGAEGRKAELFGVSMGILAGDIQQAWSQALVLGAVEDGVRAEVVLAVLERLNRVVNPGLISGEAIDVEFELRPAEEVSVEEMERMYRLKTGLLLRFAAEAGAMVGLDVADAGDNRVRELGQFAEDAGMAFQIQDDILGMFAVVGELGKPVGSDLRKGKRTLLFAEALRLLEGADRERFVGWLGNAEVGDEEVAAAAGLIRECGALASLEAQAAGLIAGCRERLGVCEVGAYRELLDGWAEFVTGRRY